MSTKPAQASKRDPRVDFFRGLAFIIILIAHVPGNHLVHFIPARFGFSDATEMFVFMSGFAAAIAFGATFYKAGFWRGSARVALRVWQVYTAHLTLFFFSAMLLVAGTVLLGTRDYVAQLNLTFFFEETTTALLGIFTLTYVPNLFDILPMYIGVLIMMPFVVGLSMIRPWLGPLACVAVYLFAWTIGGLELPAEPFSDRTWFFNPLGWQLIFFTGFAISMGWIKGPVGSRGLMYVCVGFLLFGVVVGYWPLAQNFEALRDFREWIWPLLDKHDLGILRYLHFLALAYVVVELLRGREWWLTTKWGTPILKCGQQSLPVFMFSIVFSLLAGMGLDVLGRSWWSVIVVNGVAIAALIGVAYLLGWLKSNPWRGRQPDKAPPPSRPAEPAPGSTLATGSPSGRAAPMGWKPAEATARTD